MIAEDKIRLENPWPDIESMKDIERIQLSLDGGGREIVEELLQDNNIKNLVEVGAFLCGSTRRWLEANPNLTVFCIDSWGSGLRDYLDKLISTFPQWIENQVDRDQLRTLIGYYDTYGIMEVALNNIKEYRDRLIPIRKNAPEVYEYLKSSGLEPDVIYIDANKQWPEFISAHENFPDAIICGDDWTWKDSNGEYPVRDYVQKLADIRNKKVIAKDATWLIQP